MVPRNNVIPLFVHQYPQTSRLALRAGLLPFHGDDYCLVDAYARSMGVHSVFRGARVLANAPITSMNLLLFDALLAMGAQVHVMNTPSLVMHDSRMGEYDALMPLRQSGIPHVLGDRCASVWRSITWDVMIDSGKELYRLIQSDHLRLPKKGIVTLAKAQAFDDSFVPLISIGDSELQTKLADQAGERFIRSLAQVWVQDSLSSQQCAHTKRLGDLPFQSIFNQRFVVVGMGKLGQSIAKALLRAGVPPQHLVIVDKHRGTLQHARHLFPLAHSVLIASHDMNNERLKKHLSQAFCVISCTGVPKGMTRFPVEWFDKVVHLANMGADDEWHECLPKSRFLGAIRHPLNFKLAAPIAPAVNSLLIYTQLRCAEYALNRRCALPPGVLPVPPQIEADILQQSTRYRVNHPGQSYGFDPMAKAVDELLLSLPRSRSKTTSFKQFGV